MPSSAVGSVGNDKGAVYCFLFIPPSVAWAAGLSRWGYPPLNPGRPPERAGESTRTPLISPEKLALPRPARGAPLASSLAGFFRETGGQWGPHPRTSPCAPVWPTASAYGFFLPPRRVNLDLTFDLVQISCGFEVGYLGMWNWARQYSGDREPGVTIHIVLYIL